MGSSTRSPRVNGWPASLRRLTVGDVLHAGVISCPAETSLETVAGILAGERIHSVVITLDDGWGLLTDRDLLAAARIGQLDEPARRYAATEVVTVDPGGPLRRAIELMVEHDLSHLLVVAGEPGRPIGVLSSLDVAGAVAERRV